MYFGKRYYSPYLQRWTQPDPLEVHSPGESGEPNLYSYVGGHALKSVDVDGLFEEPVHGALTFRLALAAGFSEQDSAKLALTTAGVDHDPKTEPTSLKNIDAGITENYHFLKPELALKITSMAVATGDLRTFGQTLHVLQDVGFTDALGPHKRSHNWGIGHPFRTAETGAWGHPLNHVADQAYQDPVANLKELTRVFEIMQSAAGHFGYSPSDAGRAQAIAAIKEVIAADTKEAVDQFLHAVPKGATRSYAQLVAENQANGGKSTNGVTWGVDDIDSSVAPAQVSSALPPPSGEGGHQGAGNAAPAEQK